MIEKLTPEAKKIIQTGIGYRCTEQESEYHKSIDVLDYEINELYNDDIPDTIQNLYNYKTTNIHDLSNFINNRLNTKQFELIWLASDPLDCIEFYSDHHKRYQSLAQAVHKDDTRIPVVEFLLPIEQALLISDCGPDGQLFAYPADLTLQQKQIN